MKAGRTLQEVAAELQRQLATKKDYRAPTEKITLYAEPRLAALDAAIEATQTQTVLDRVIKMSIDGIGRFGLTRRAHTQLAEYAKIPQAYYDRMLSDDPALLARNVNRWVGSATEREKRPTVTKWPEPDSRLIRTLDGNVRSVLSPRYRMIDNWDIAQAVIPTLSRWGCEVVSSEVTEDHLYLKAVSPRLQGTIGGPHTPPALRSVVQMGVVVSNSETGQGAVKVEPLVYILVCLNGATIPDQAVRKYHIGRHNGDSDTATQVFKDDTLKADDAALRLKLRDTVDAAFDEAKFKSLIGTMQDASERKLTTPPSNLVEAITRNHGLSETEADGVMQHLISGGSLTQWGLSNAVTAYAQADALTYERATELERTGGEILTMAIDEWNKKYAA
jgi:hypothetical protein